MKNTNLIINKISTGKTRGIMFEEMSKLISNNENILIVDNKEEYYKTYAKNLKDEGYNVYVINLKNPEKSSGFNPLLYPYDLYKNGSKDLATRIVNEMANELTYVEGSMDPFWSESAAAYLTGLCLMLFNNANEKEINFGSIQTMLSEDELVTDYVKKLSVVSSEYIYLSSTALAPVDTKGGILSVLKSELNKYISSESLLNLLTSNELNISSLNNKTAIFVIGTSRYSKLTNIIIDEINSSTYKFTYIIDNADSLTKINSLKDMLEEASVKNNKIYYITRNEDIIKEKYGKYITEMFEEINKTAPLTIYPLGNYDEYPLLRNGEKNYFDLRNILNK